MKAIVVGGGKVGYYLVKTLKEKRYEVILVEKDLELCNKIAEGLNIDVICGDGSNLDVLSDAQIEEAEVIAAVTGKDEENFVICQRIKLSFENIRTIARINNPKNSKVFKALGINDTVCSTEVISNIIEQELSNSKLKIIQPFNRGKITLVEFEIVSNSPLNNMYIRDLSLPVGFLIVSILRGEEIIYPSSDIKIENNDKLMAIVPTNKIEEAENYI